MPRRKQPDLVLSEKSNPSFETHWYCEPPGLHEIFMVVREEWTVNYDIRRIYEWKYPPDNIEMRQTDE
jgi:hypothetical protein